MEDAHRAANVAVTGYGASDRAVFDQALACTGDSAGAVTGTGDNHICQHHVGHMASAAHIGEEAGAVVFRTFNRQILDGKPLSVEGAQEGGVLRPANGGDGDAGHVQLSGKFIGGVNGVVLAAELLCHGLQISGRGELHRLTAAGQRGSPGGGAALHSTVVESGAGGYAAQIAPHVGGLYGVAGLVSSVDGLPVRLVLGALPGIGGGGAAWLQLRAEGLALLGNAADRHSGEGEVVHFLGHFGILPAAQIIGAGNGGDDGVLFHGLGSLVFDAVNADLQGLGGDGDG